MADETNVTTTTGTGAQPSGNSVVGNVGAQSTQSAASNSAGNAGTQSTQQQENKPNGDLERLIQSAVDRATQKLGTENKKLRGEIETLKKANLDADELKKLEMSEKEKEIAERERALTEKENRLTAIKEIKAIGLDDGSDAALAIVDFVMAEDEAGIKERVKAFDALVKRIVQSRVDGVFKANGRTPGVGTDGTGGGKETDSYAAKLGKSTAAANKAAQSILDQYIGGK